MILKITSLNLKKLRGIYGRNVSMLSVFSICLFGNNIGVHYILIGIVLLLFVLFVVVIGGDIYDMRGDILAKKKKK